MKKKAIPLMWLLIIGRIRAAEIGCIWSASVTERAKLCMEASMASRDRLECKRTIWLSAEKLRELEQSMVSRSFPVEGEVCSDADRKEVRSDGRHPVC
jgi:hypothetical protein